MVIVVTGPKCAGKSSSLMKVADILKENRRSVGGVISSRIWKNGERFGYDLVTLPDGAKRLLATETEGILDNTYKYCTFFFSNDALAAGNKAIREGFNADLLIVDEIGNMDISGAGWGESIQYLASRKRPVVLGVREGVADKIRDKWGLTVDKVITVSPENDITGKILQATGFEEVLR